MRRPQLQITRVKRETIEKKAKEKEKKRSKLSTKTKVQFFCAIFETISLDLELVKIK